MDLRGAIQMNDMQMGTFKSVPKKVMRAMGDTTPSAFLSMNFHAIVAAKLIGVPVDDLFDMNAADFKNITVAVAGFLLA